MNQENEKFATAWGQVQLYANTAWAPQSNDDFISANQRLWTQKSLHEFNTRRSQVQNVFTEKAHKPQIPVREENIVSDSAGRDRKRLSVKDVIPESRLARFYGNFYYDEERESCYTADVDIKSSFISRPPADIEDENVECWMSPKVDYWFQKFMGKSDELSMKTEESVVEPTPAPENLDGISQANVSTRQPGKLTDTNGKNRENQRKILKLKEDEQQEDSLRLPTIKQGRNIPGWLFQLDAIYPELNLPNHLASVSINISFSFFSCENIVLQPSARDLSKPGLALYVPTLQSEEEKILYEKVYSEDGRQIWRVGPLVERGQPSIRTPIFPLTPDLTSALERALQHFKVHMRNIYSTNDPFNKQKKPTSILSQSRKIIQSRHRHKPPRIQSAFKSNLLNVEAPEFFPIPQMIKSHQDALISSLFELFPKTWPQNNLLKTVDIVKNINSKLILLGGVLASGKSAGNAECDKHKSNSGQKTAAFKSYPINPPATSGTFVDGSQHQKLIPVYQKPPETYVGRLTKNLVSSSSKNINSGYSPNCGSSSQNSNLILLTNSKKNKLKDTSKTRSLENIKISSESTNQHNVNLFLDQQKSNECASQDNALDFKINTERNNNLCEQKAYFQRTSEHHSKMTKNVLLNSDNSLSSKKLIENLSGEKFTIGKGSVPLFSEVSNNLCTDKKSASSNYSRRRKTDFRDKKNETENVTKKPITLLRKTPTPPTTLQMSPNTVVTVSPREHPTSPWKNSSPHQTKSPKAKSPVVKEVSKQTNKTPREPELVIKCNKFTSDGHISIKNANKKNVYTFSHKKKIPGPTVPEVTNVTSGRRLYSAVLTNSPHGHFPQTNSISCESFSSIFPPPDSDLSDLNKSPGSVAGNLCHCSSVETVYSADAHFEKLEREALEQYKLSDESIDSKLEELERQAIEQYSSSNISCGGCGSQHKLSNDDSIFNDEAKVFKSTDQIPKAIDSVVIYSTASAGKSNGVSVNKKSKSFKTAGNKMAGKHNKKKHVKSPL